MEVAVSTTDVQSESAAGAAIASVDMRLEVVVLPVSDVDRAKRFYESLGWRLDADLATSEDFRVVQLTPPGSPTAVIFGTGVTTAEPGAVDSLILVVDDIDAARATLLARGVAVSEVFHDSGGVFHHAGTAERVPGPDPERRSYGSWIAFDDPDGNGWMAQEITTRLPGRVDATDVATLAGLLRETAEHHGAFEAATPPHDWWDWYAPYLHAREQGLGSDEATEAADRYMREQRGIARGA
jgi:catechol 2,3-dioxygenase-like lactoylglutathione lyase family enzyme